MHGRFCGFLWLMTAMLAAAPALATPVHYLVFELDAAGDIKPQYYARVEMAAGAHELLAALATAPARGEASLEYRLAGPGGELGSYRLHLPPLRGEFARDPGVDNRIESVPVDADGPQAFVLRLPAGTVTQVAFLSPGKPQAFALDHLAARAQELPLARAARPLLQRAPRNGPPGNRIDTLVFAEGYTAGEQAKFDADAANFHDRFFGLTPYLEYESFVNWTTAFVASSQSGADHPPWQAGCTSQSCCADAYAQSDPRAGTFVDTAFNGRFCTNQIHRLLTVNTGLVYAAASSWPDWDEIFVIVNDPVYGGAGGSFAVSSTHPLADQVVLHEYAHTFTDLADEYSSPYPGFPPCSDTGAGAPCEANVTNQTIAAQVKWRDWFTPGNPIPTPPGTPGVGLFQGARYLASGMYRPVDTQCLMRQLDTPFCPVCRQAYVQKLYAGGWGIPAGGIDLVEPGSESPAPGLITMGIHTSRQFAVTPLWPSVGSLDISWWLDGAQLLPLGAESIYFQAAATPGMHLLEVRIRDTSWYSSTSLPLRGRAWSIDVVDDLIFRNGFQ